MNSNWSWIRQDGNDTHSLSLVEVNLQKNVEWKKLWLLQGVESDLWFFTGNVSVMLPT